MPETSETEFSGEQLEQIRKNLLQQIESMPPEKADELREQIESMPDSDLIEFVKKNTAMQQGGEGGQCIFCLISEGKVESSRIYEDSEIVSVLDINPMSRGHALIIPKEHISETEQLKAGTFEKARMLAGMLKKELKADSIEILTSSRLGHAIINIIPAYNNIPSFDFKRQKISKEDLKNTADILAGALKDSEEKSQENVEKEQKAKASEEVKNIRIKRRIP